MRTTVYGALAAAAALSFALLGCGSSEPAVVDTSTSDDAAVEQDLQEEQAEQDLQEEQAEQSAFDLAAGTAVDVGDGLTVSVDAVETGVVAYDGSLMVKATVTYTNGGDGTADFNEYDWKGEDANGAQEYAEYFAAEDYSSDDAALGSGSLAAGGTKTGTIYFKEGTVKLLYFANMFNDEAAASWSLQ